MPCCVIKPRDPEFDYYRILLLRTGSASREDIAKMERSEVISKAEAIRATLEYIPEECKTPGIDEMRRMTSAELAELKKTKQDVAYWLYHANRSLNEVNDNLGKLRWQASQYEMQDWASEETRALLQKAKDELDERRRMKDIARDSVLEVLRAICEVEEEIINGPKRQKFDDRYVVVHRSSTKRR